MIANWKAFIEALIGTSSVKTEVLSWSAINFPALLFVTVEEQLLKSTCDFLLLTFLSTHLLSSMYFTRNAGSPVMGAHYVFLPWGPEGSQSAPGWICRTVILKQWSHFCSPGPTLIFYRRQNFIIDWKSSKCVINPQPTAWLCLLPPLQ